MTAKISLDVVGTVAHNFPKTNKKNKKLWLVNAHHFDQSSPVFVLTMFGSYHQIPFPSPVHNPRCRWNCTVILQMKICRCWKKENYGAGELLGRKRRFLKCQSPMIRTVHLFGIMTNPRLLTGKTSVWMIFFFS